MLGNFKACTNQFSVDVSSVNEEIIERREREPPKEDLALKMDAFQVEAERSPHSESDQESIPSMIIHEDKGTNGLYVVNFLFPSNFSVHAVCSFM